MRGVAIAGVLLHHDTTWANGPLWIGGHHGVTLFFVLSGFLITSLLLEEHQATGFISLRYFYARRVARIVPALLLALVGSVIYALVNGMHPDAMLLGVFASLFFVSNWVQGFGARDIAGTFAWSLSIEEQFYLSWPLLMRRWLPNVRRLAILCIILIVAAEALRLLPHPIPAYYMTFTRWDAIAAGCLASIAMHVGWRMPRPHLVAAISLAFLLVLIITADELSYGYSVESAFVYLAVELAAAALIAAVLSAPTAMGILLAWTPLALLGDYSYGLYLWNRLQYELLAHVGSLPVPVALFLTILPVFGMAWLSRRFVEEPARRFVRRWWRERGSGLPRSTRSQDAASA